MNIFLCLEPTVLQYVRVNVCVCVCIGRILDTIFISLDSSLRCNRRFDRCQRCTWYYLLIYRQNDTLTAFKRAAAAKATVTKNLHFFSHLLCRSFSFHSLISINFSFVCLARWLPACLLVEWIVLSGARDLLCNSITLLNFGAHPSVAIET